MARLSIASAVVGVITRQRACRSESRKSMACRSSNTARVVCAAPDTADSPDELAPSWRSSEKCAASPASGRWQLSC